MKGNIVLFEPWTLGDVVIAVYTAKLLKDRDYNVSIVCSVHWKEWLLTLNLFDEVIGFRLPWTEKKQKYNITRYSLHEFLELRNKLKNLLPNYICDIRGDIRNFFLLNILNVTKVISLFESKKSNVYQRPLLLLRKMNIDVVKKDFLEPPTISQNNIERKIICFFGASWKNRQVPMEKSIDIVTSLLNIGYRVIIILQPIDDIKIWDKIKDLYSDKILTVKGSINSVVDEIKNSSVCISTDSGWLHIATFYRIPTIGLFGYDTINEWAPPYTEIVCSKPLLPASDRYKKKKEEDVPLQYLSTEEVVEKCNNLLLSKRDQSFKFFGK